MADDCPVFEQDPLDKRVLNIDFGNWLGSGVTIASVSWVVPSALNTFSDSFTDTVATNYFQAADSTKEDEYPCACTITTDDAVPRLKTQRFIIRVEKDC